MHLLILGADPTHVVLGASLQRAAPRNLQVSGYLGSSAHADADATNQTLTRCLISMLVPTQAMVGPGVAPKIYFNRTRTMGAKSLRLEPEGKGPACRRVFIQPALTALHTHLFCTRGEPISSKHNIHMAIHPSKFSWRRHGKSAL